MSVLDQYSHANHQKFFSEIIFCFEKEATSFYRNYQCVI